MAGTLGAEALFQKCGLDRSAGSSAIPKIGCAGSARMSWAIQHNSRFLARLAANRGCDGLGMTKLRLRGSEIGTTEGRALPDSRNQNHQRQHPAPSAALRACSVSPKVRERQGRGIRYHICFHVFLSCAVPDWESCGDYWRDELDFRLKSGNYGKYR